MQFGARCRPRAVTHFDFVAGSRVRLVLFVREVPLQTPTRHMERTGLRTRIVLEATAPPIEHARIPL